jgi:glutamate-5-semialdehyde dehydrogenase
VSLEGDVVALCRAARAAAPAIARATTAEKDAALHAGAKALRARTDELLAANAGDVEAARAAGVAAAFLDRLTLTPARVDAMAVGLEQIAALPDPVGEEIARWSRPNGLDIQQVRVPLGVIGIIYESRPNVTADAAGLCLKSGNAVVLRGGSEAFRTNCLIADVLRDAATTIPRDAIALVRSTDRAAVQILLKQDDLIDVIIPRGGEELIRAITEGSRIPVIQHLKGVCQLYVDAKADVALAEKLVMNAKTQRPGVCNAIENLLVHRDVAATLLPTLAHALGAAGVEVRGCPETVRLVPGAKPATGRTGAPSIST